MTTIRILHISDLHLAEQANRRSVLDRSAAVRAEIETALATDIKDSVLKGDADKLRSAFKDLLAKESIAELLSARRVSREEINDTIDKALKKIVLGDGSFKRAAAEFLRDQTIASSFDLRLLYCLCQFIEDEEPNLKVILITGDLATTGFKGDLTRGLSFLEGPSTPSIANVPSDKKLLLPGNHDRYKYTDDGFLYAPGGQLFDTTFGNYWSGPVKQFEPLRNGKLSVIIIAADFGLQSKDDCTFPLLKISRLAQGRVYKHIRQELVRRTKELQDQEQRDGFIPVVMWAIHFPPFFRHKNAGWTSQVVYKLTKNLIKEKALVRDAKKHNVAAILAGHTHEAQDYVTRKGAVRVLCAGSATQDDPAAKQCQIIEVSLAGAKKPAITIIEYEPDLSATSFKPRI